MEIGVDVIWSYPIRFHSSLSLCDMLLSITSLYMTLFQEKHVEILQIVRLAHDQIEPWIGL